MLPPDRRERVADFGIAPAEATVSDPYVQVFEQRFAALESFVSGRTTDVNFDMNSVGLKPDKFTAAVFYEKPSSFELLLSRNPHSGYYLGDHDVIAEENLEVYSSNKRIGTAFVAEMNGLRIALIGKFLPQQDADNDKLKDVLKRYGISMILSYIGKEIIPVLNDQNVDAKSVTQYIDIVDRIIFDGITTQIAEVYGLNNTEYLRLRLINELPPNKQTPRLDIKS